MTNHEGVSRRVGVFAPLYPPAVRGGGPIRSIEALIQSAVGDVSVYVITADRDLGQHVRLAVTPNEWTNSRNGVVRYVSLTSPRRIFNAFGALKAVRPELLHFNSFFHPSLSIIPLLLWRLGYWGKTQILLSPRGEFGSGALARRSLKKRAYIWLFRLLGLHRAVIWHSTATHETDAIRELWGPEARIVFRENDTLLPAEPASFQISADGNARFTFLGRIVEHKGLLILINALETVRSNVSLDVYGAPEDAAYEARCRAAVRKLPAHARVRFHGLVDPGEVRGVLVHSDVLLMPTAGENFGHVIAEALSASCFVVTTPLTPWTNVLCQGGGAIVRDRSPDSWRTAIESLARLDPDGIARHRQAAGQAYKDWARREKRPHVWDLAMAVSDL